MITRAFVAGLLVFGAVQAYAADPSALDLLKDSDRARGSAAASDGISWEVVVNSDDGA